LLPAAGTETTVTFSVNLSALRGLPAFLDRRAHDLTATGMYVRANTGLHDALGLANIFRRHERNVGVITGYLAASAQHCATADSQRLRQAIANYANADARAAQRYDSTLPAATGMPSSAVSQHLGPDVFSDRANPTSSLVKPADHNADFPYQPSWYDLLSPTSMARDLVWKLTGIAAHLGVLDRPYDPFEWFVEPYVGDWAGLLRAAEVFEHVAACLDGETAQLTQAGTAVTQVWHGNAAGLCAANLSAFQSRLAGGAAPLRDLAGVYRQVAAGVHDNGEMMATAIMSLFDWAAESFMDVESGGFIGMYEAGSAIHNFVRAVRLALHIASALQDIVTAGVNASDEAIHRLGILDTVIEMPPMSSVAPAMPTGP
jgi:hypothetical protein